MAITKAQLEEKKASLFKVKKELDRLTNDDIPDEEQPEIQELQKKIDQGFKILEEMRNELAKSDDDSNVELVNSYSSSEDVKKDFNRNATILKKKIDEVNTDLSKGLDGGLDEILELHQELENLLKALEKKSLHPEDWANEQMQLLKLGEEIYALKKKLEEFKINNACGGEEINDDEWKEYKLKFISSAQKWPGFVTTEVNGFQTALGISKEEVNDKKYLIAKTFLNALKDNMTNVRVKIAFTVTNSLIDFAKSYFKPSSGNAISLVEFSTIWRDAARNFSENLSNFDKPFEDWKSHIIKQCNGKLDKSIIDKEILEITKHFPKNHQIRKALSEAWVEGAVDAGDQDVFVDEGAGYIKIIMTCFVNIDKDDNHSYKMKFNKACFDDVPNDVGLKEVLKRSFGDEPATGLSLIKTPFSLKVVINVSFKLAGRTLRGDSPIVLSRTNKIGANFKLEQSARTFLESFLDKIEATNLKYDETKVIELWNKEGKFIPTIGDLTKG